MWVIDVSVLIRALIEQDGSGLADEVLSDDTGERIAPVTAISECANAVLRKMRHEGLPAAAARDALQALHDLRVRFVPIHGFNALSLFDIARSVGITAHDAVYLLLAEDHDASLVTADGRLLNATRDNPRWQKRVIALADWPQARG